MLDRKPGSVQAQSTPPHAGTKHLVRLIRGKSCLCPQQMGRDIPRGVLVLGKRGLHVRLSKQPDRGPWKKGSRLAARSSISSIQIVNVGMSGSVVVGKVRRGAVI